MSPAAPRVSVLLPVFNGAETLAESLGSIRTQDLTDIEIVCVDDGSTDETPHLLAEAARADDRIRIVTQANGGVTAALNTGLAHCTAPLIARMDADDRSEPHRLRRQVAAMAADPDAVLVSCDIATIHDDGSAGASMEQAARRHLLPFTLLFFNAIGGHSQVLFRRDAIDAVGGYDPGHRHVEDYDLWCRLARQGRFVVIPEELHTYRRNGAGVSSLHASEQAANATLVAQRELEAVLGEPVEAALVELGVRFWKPGASPVLAPHEVGRMSTLHETLIPAFVAPGAGPDRIRPWGDDLDSRALWRAVGERHRDALGRNLRRSLRRTKALARSTYRSLR